MWFSLMFFIRISKTNWFVSVTFLTNQFPQCQLREQSIKGFNKENRSKIVRFFHVSFFFKMGNFKMVDSSHFPAQMSKTFWKPLILIKSFSIYKNSIHSITETSCGWCSRDALVFILKPNVISKNENKMCEKENKKIS